MALPDPRWVGMLGLALKVFAVMLKKMRWELGSSERVAACIAGSALLNFTI